MSVHVQDVKLATSSPPGIVAFVAVRDTVTYNENAKRTLCSLYLGERAEP